MADAVLSVEISAKIDALRDAFNKARSETGKFSSDTDKKLNEVDKGFEKLANEIDKSLKRGATSARTASTSISKDLAKTAQVTGNSGQAIAKGSNSAAFALTNLGRVAQDAPFGFIGIQNNLNPLLESFQQLRKESGSNVSALKALGSSLIGPAGIGIALSVVSAGILLYQEYTRKAAKDTKELANATTDLAKSASDEIGKLTLLFDAATNANIPLSERKKIVDQLQSQYPAYFKNLTDEEILAGNAANAYKQLTKDLINSSIARGAEKLISEQVNKLAELSISLGLAAAKTKGLTDAQKAVRASGAGGFFIDETSSKKELKTIEGFRKEAQDEIDAIREAVKQVTSGFNASSILGNFGGGTEAKKAIQNITELRKQISLLNEPNSITAVGQFPEIGTNLLEQSVNRVGELIGRIQSTTKAGLSGAEKDFLAFNENLSNIIDSGLNQTFAGLGEAIGNSLANGANVISAIGTTLLSSFGNIAIQLGQLAIGTGIAVEGIKTALKSLAGPIAIAAGVALIALGSAVKGAAANIGGGGGKQGSYQIPKFASGVTNFGGGVALVGERGPELVNLPTGSNVITNQNTNRLLSNQRASTSVVIPDVRIQGSDLVVVFNRANKNLNRTT